MRKKKLHNLCFYIFKYILMLMPLILLLIVEIFPTMKIENNYNNVETTSVEGSTTLTFNQRLPLSSLAINDYNTNTGLISYDVTPTSIFTLILIPEHVYYYKISFVDYDTNYPMRIKINGIYNFLYNTDYEYTNYIFTQGSEDTSLLLNYASNYRGHDSINSYYIKIIDLTLLGLPDADVSAINNLFPLNYYPYNEGQDITIDSLTITNTISDSSNIISSNQSREVNISLLTPFTSLYNLSVNDWYMDILNTIGLDTNNEITKYIACMPLWVLWVELFYLIGFCLSLIPKLFNRWLSFDD